MDNPLIHAAMLIESGEQEHPCFAIIVTDCPSRILHSWHNLFQPNGSDIGRPEWGLVYGHWGQYLTVEEKVLALLFGQAMLDEGDLFDTEGSARPPWDDARAHREPRATSSEGGDKHHAQSALHLVVKKGSQCQKQN